MTGRKGSNAVTAFVLAHLSDPHLGPLPQAEWPALLNKRLSGFLSWTQNRIRIHRRDVLDLLTADLARQNWDHAVVTGDLVNISLPAEFTAAAEWLSTLGPADRVTVIPGNHDAYVDVPWQESLSLWAPYMRGQRQPGEDDRLPRSHDDFPFTRRLGPVALIGTTTALPMPLFVAAGRLGAKQCERLAGQLRTAGADGLFRIVLIHHPPFGGGAYKRKSLLDAKAFQEVIAEAGAELVLHGHTHVSGLGRIATAVGPVPVFGVPSASAVRAGHKDPARYHLYTIRKEPDSWSLDVEIRGLNAAADGFERQGRMSMAIPLTSGPQKAYSPSADQPGAAAATA
ncbi:3',5'-cyclic AMP phosphodiesterase CpdA [Dongia mobilis]|uniref:3',5'-cyclic AMP phosphodiesterase CpdA n=1 Tax=Dongia mobilis TaxID=578943 RepID=A0A4R6WQD0_9PROT|nr:metallophosphoesterase [Dongia mobilis]TDQ81460.1 3',5'-cyclic AMP phosphodiesterase CpdA [Dongia mobilis]